MLCLSDVIKSCNDGCDVCCVDADRNAEVVYKCTSVTESTAQLVGVCFGLFHSVSHFRISRVSGPSMFIDS